MPSAASFSDILNLQRLTAGATDSSDHLHQQVENRFDYLNEVDNRAELHKEDEEASNATLGRV